MADMDGVSGAAVADVTDVDTVLPDVGLTVEALTRSVGVSVAEAKWPAEEVVPADTKLLALLEDLDVGCWPEIAAGLLLTCDEGCCGDEMIVDVIDEYDGVEEECGLV